MNLEEWEKMTLDERFAAFEAEAEYKKPIDPMFMDGDPESYDGHGLGNGTAMFEYELPQSLDLRAVQLAIRPNTLRNRLVLFLAKVVVWFRSVFTRRGRARRVLQKILKG